MYYAIGVSVSSLHRESTDSLIKIKTYIQPHRSIIHVYILFNLILNVFGTCLIDTLVDLFIMVSSDRGLLNKELFNINFVVCGVCGLYLDPSLQCHADTYCCKHTLLTT